MSNNAQKFMGRREIRQALEPTISDLVDQIEWLVELNCEKWRLEAGFDSLKPIHYIDLSVSIDTINGQDVIADKMRLVIPEKYKEIE